MKFLVSQIWLLLLASFVLGAAFGWLLKSWRAQRLAVALADARARHAADATESARQRNEINELGARLKKLEAELLSVRSSADSSGAESAALRAQLEALQLQLDLALERQAELESLRAQAGSVAAALEARSVVMVAELENQRERLRTSDRELEASREELTQVREMMLRLEQKEQIAQPASAHGAGAPAMPALQADDLQQIVGVGPKLDALLHTLGIRHYAQIARWTDAELDQAAAQLPGFGSRIRRDDWRGQCRVLHRLKYGREV